MFRSRWLAAALSVLALAFAAVLPASAQRYRPDQWVKLGEQTVGFGVDRDVIELGREDGRFTAIKLIVRRNDIFLIDLKVTYLSGDTQDLAVRQPIRANSETAALMLAPSPRGLNGRSLQRIDLVYRSRPGFNGQAVVEVWGIRAGDAGGPAAGYGGPPPQRYYASEVPRGFVLFATQTVGFQTERDVIRLGRDAGRFGRIAIRVLRNDILLREMTINYSRGETQRLLINAEISANGITTPIDIKDGRIDSIQLVYQARPGFRGQAVVEVYGEYAQSWLGDRGRPDYTPQRGARAEWLLLGAQRADMLKPDADVFQVGRQFGPIRQLKVRAVGHAIELRGMTIIYGNGQREDVPIRSSLRGGQETQPIDLRGRERFVEAVEMRYQTKFNLGGNATVELYGLH